MTNIINTSRQLSILVFRQAKFHFMSQFSKHDSRLSFKTTNSIRRVPVDMQSLYNSKTVNTQSDYKSVYFRSEVNVNFSTSSNLGLYGSGLPANNTRIPSFFKKNIFKSNTFKNLKNKFLKTDQAPQRRIERNENIKLKRLLHLFPKANQELLEKSLQIFDGDEQLAIQWCLNQLSKY